VNGTTACKDLMNDAGNCGVCGGPGGQACGAGKVCSAGTCQLTCGAGLSACGASCIDLAHDPGHCGTCTNICGPYPNASPFCAPGGNCALACGAGFADCNGLLSDGCEVTLATDKNNCGRCGNVCPPRDNADPACAANSCGMTCKTGFRDCNNNIADGCESSASSDAANCGTCGNDCSVASATTPFCSSNVCVGSSSGVQQNVATSLLGGLGWGPGAKAGAAAGDPCYVGSFASTTALSAVQAACNGANILIGCRVAGSPTLLVAAAGLATDVFGSSTLHSATGVTWYFDSTSALGFAPAGSTITRTPCDTAGGAADSYAAGSGTQRMCWRAAAGNLMAGGRCGDRENLGPATTYERVIFTK
jgi:hypothetical protein